MVWFKPQPSFWYISIHLLFKSKYPWQKEDLKLYPSFTCNISKPQAFPYFLGSFCSICIQFVQNSYLALYLQQRLPMCSAFHSALFLKVIACPAPLSGGWEPDRQPPLQKSTAMWHQNVSRSDRCNFHLLKGNPSTWSSLFPLLTSEKQQGHVAASALQRSMMPERTTKQHNGKNPGS